MNLTVLTPHGVMIRRPVRKVTADGRQGVFCLLPRHADVVAALEPGLLTYETEKDQETLALDRGILVKCGDEVRIAVRRAVRGRHIDELEQTVHAVFEELDEGERKSRSALARLEAALVTEFAGLGEEGPP